MASTRTYSGRQLRSLWGAFLRKNRRSIVVVVAVEIISFSIGTWALLHAFGDGPVVTYVLGALHAAIVAILYFTLRISFIAANQDAVRQMRGDFGETFTRDELKKAKRRRLIWGWVDSITVSGGDIDHLVVTRGGGLVAIDSKWRSSTIGSDIERSAVAALKSAGRATSVLRHLGYFKREHTARRRADARSVVVTPLVALWGPISRDVPPAARVQDVDFVAGAQLVGWLQQQSSEKISRRAARRLLAELEDFRKEHQQA